MSNKRMVPVADLGQLVDGKIYIKGLVEELVLINECINLVILEGANVSFLDSTNSCNVVIEVKENAFVNYTILNSNNTNREFLVSGELKINQISLEATNENINVKLLRENANCDIKCLSISVSNNNIFEQYIDHLKPYTYSNIANVGVALNGSNITFNTTGKIQKGMNNSKCSQLSRGVVMDDVSSVTSLPILLIDEYDCFANHGATIGKMSDEDLFYLMSRGLSKKEAFLLILQGIINPFISAITVDDIKEKIAKQITNMIEM